MFARSNVTYVALVCAMLSGCSNLATVRTFSSAIATAGGQTTTLITADKSTCSETNTLVAEYNSIRTTQDPKFSAIGDVSCSKLVMAEGIVTNESKALNAYGTALGQLAQDQYVTTTTDGSAVSATLGSLGVAGPVAGAVNTVFKTVEGWALEGYRQRDVHKAMSPDMAAALKTVVGDMSAVSAQYSDELDYEKGILSTMASGIAGAKVEPVAVAEMNVRLASLQEDVATRKAAIAAYLTALGDMSKAYDAAVEDLAHPSKPEIVQAVKTFANEVESAQQALTKAK